MKKVFLIILLFMGSIALSQDLLINNNPYDNADETTKSRKAFQREKWFYEQRMYPENFIPSDAYEKAYIQKEDLKRSKGIAMQGVFDSWNSLGPRTGFYFAYSNITSRMTTVKYDPLNPSIIYAGAAFGGIWKSSNGGNNWTAMTDNEQSMSSGSIAIDPNNTNIVYYGTGEATYSAASYYGRGVLKSTDGGANWKSYPGNFEGLSYCSRLAIRPGNSSQLLAAMGTGGLYRSTNSGEAWIRIASGRCDDVIFSPTGDTAYAVGSGTGYLISYNGGATFSSNGALSMGTRNHITVCKSVPSVIYFARYSGSSITVFKSTNAGSTFSQIVSGQNFSGSQAWYDFYMHVNPFDPNYAYVGSVDIWRTTNGGVSNFTNITNGYGGGNVHVDQHNVDFHPTDPQQMLCVNDGGIWKSTDRGSTWTNQNTNQTLTQFYRIASDPSNASHILGGTQDNGTQRTTGTLNWSAAFGGDGGEVCFHSVNNSYILGETQNNGVLRSTNGGASFSSATSGLSGSASWVGPLLSHPDSAGIFYTARQTVFKSTNWGASWFSISTGTSGTIREMGIGKSSPNIMYATSSSSIYRSTNRGYTFVNVTNGLPGKVITSVNVHPDSSSVAILTCSGFGTPKFYKTTNQGSSWFSISGNLPDSPINDGLIYYPGAATSTYFAATDVGVFVSNDYGQNWLEVANGLPNTVAINLDHHAATNKLRVGTHGRGTFEIQLSSFSSVDAASIDAGVSGVQTFASTSVSPIGTVRNYGTAPASINVTRTISPGGYSNTVSIASLAGGSSTDVTFGAWTFAQGTTYIVRDSVYLNGDINNSNDISTAVLVPYLGQTVVKLCEGFNSGTFPPTGWTRKVISGTSTHYWSRNSVSSYGKGTGSAAFGFWNSPFGSIQSLESPVFSATINGDSLQFDFAYAARTSGATDSLIVESSTNGGTSFFETARYWGNNFNGNLNTAGANVNEFIPSISQWSTRRLPTIAGVNKIRFRAVSENGNNFFVDSIKIATNFIQTPMQLTAAPEGFISSLNGNLNMPDSIRVYLRRITSPYGIVDSSLGVLDSVTKSALVNFSGIESGVYYVSVKHRNSLETWSKAGGESVTAGQPFAFDFTAGLSQAYGSNQTIGISGIACLFSGDVNYDGIVDAADLQQIDNDAIAFVTGYVQSDVDGNNFIDATDASITDNNAANFVGIVRP